MTILPGRFAIARLAPDDPIPDWVGGHPLCSITRTAHELSILAPELEVPRDVQREDDLVALAVDGPLDVGLVGVLGRIATILAAVDVPILALSTFDTDYVFVRHGRLATALQALEDAGIAVSQG